MTTAALAKPANVSVSAPISAVMEVYYRLPIRMVRGEGSYLFDENGKRYLDFAAGIAVNALGHCHPHLVQALEKQVRTLWHCANLVTIPDQERLARRLTALTFADKIFFCSTGVEAVEAMIKLVRRHHYQKGTDRWRIITLEGGYHGRTLAGLAAGGNAKAREGFGPLPEGFDRIPREDLGAAEAAITPDTAAILLEPVQAEGGVRPLSREYIHGLRALCDRHGILLAFDEVQCGMGRTGTLFHYEQIGVEPDVLAAAKGIGGGFPLAAMLAKGEAAQAFTPGSHGSTYGGNPLAMAAGNAVLDVLTQPGFFEQAREVAAILRAELEELRREFPEKILEVRGTGLLLGLEVAGGATPLFHALAEAGLLTTRADEGRVLRLVPPLILSRTQVEEGVGILRSVLTANA